MGVIKLRMMISILSFATLGVCLLARNTWVSLVLIAVCLLIALALLGKNISLLYNITDDNPNKKTIRLVTVFNAVCFLAVIIIVVLNVTGRIKLTDNSESMLASAITSLVILILGNLCPKLPYSKYTGLRLPWTLADEATWILAHRILGYTAIPIGVSNIIAMFTFHETTIRNGFAVGAFLLWVAIASLISLVAFYKRGANNTNEY